MDSQVNCSRANRQIDRNSRYVDSEMEIDVKRVGNRHTMDREISTNLGV